MKIMLMLMTVVALNAVADESISITATPRYPWNGKVDIKFTITGESGTKYETAFTAKDLVGGTNLTMKTLYKSDGAVANAAKEQLSPGTYNWVWDANTDLGAEFVGERVVVEGAVGLGGVQLWEDGPYWAECNVGAVRPERSGAYFMWGETVVFNYLSYSFVEKNCPSYNKSTQQLLIDGYIDSTGNLVAEHDAATVHLGAPWRMPTEVEFKALANNCVTIWTKRDGEYGRLVTGKGAYASKSIFLPATGVISGNANTGTSKYDTGSYIPHYTSGGYWSSSPGCCLSFSEYGEIRCESSFRYYGFPVRPVRDLANPPGIGTSNKFTLDCRRGVRRVATVGEDLRYDACWYVNGKQTYITDNGANIVTGDSGTKHWAPTSYGLHQLQLTVTDSDGVQVGSEAAYFAYCEKEGEVAIPDGWTEMPADMFKNCDWLTSVMIPGCVTKIPATAFSGCGGLKEVLTDYGDSERIKGLLSDAGVDLSGVTFIEWQLPCPDILPASATFDTASQEVAISCATEGATVYYTIDGSEPSVTNGRVYKGPFNIYDSMTVKAIAVKEDWKDSAVASASFTKNNGLSAAINMYDYLPDNDADAPWTVDAEVSHDGVKSVRSGAIGENGVTTMKVTVRGAGKLTFWWKSECEEWDEDYYDYGAFRVGSETEPRLRIAGMTDWKREEVVFDTTGKHVCKWEYHKDDAESIPRDCIWVDQVQWMPSDGGGKTLTTEVEVPYAWLDQYGLGDDTDFETAASRPSAKEGIGFVWQEYLLGLDPTNADDKVGIAAPQSDDPDKIALGLADGHTDGSGYVAEVRVEKDGKVVSEDGVIDLSGESDPTGLYTVAVSLVREGDAAKVAEAPAAQTIGVQKGKATMAKTAISVPWGRLNGGGPVSVADLVKTANLTVGDKLHIYNKSAKRYETWELDANKVWQPLATYLIKPDGSVSTVSAGKPTDTTVKRGSAVWLERQDPAKPYYLYGGYEAGEIETEVEAGSAAEPSWNLIAAPSIEPFDLNRIEGADAKDQIMVTTETGPVVYTFKDGAWGCDVNVTEKRKGPGGIEIEVVKRVRDTEHTTIPAGVGFWYVSQGGKPVIKW